MICPEYDDLTHLEYGIMVAKIAHLIRIDSFYFNSVQQLIKTGEHFGKLDKVKFDNVKIEEYNDNG